MVKIGYGVCVGSWDKFTTYVVPHAAGRQIMALSGQTSIAVAYNTILDAFRERDVDGVILQHDDLEITDPAGEAKLVAELADPKVGLVGVAGGEGGNGLAWWNHSPVGHQRTDAMDIDFGPRTGDVELLEGSILLFSRWAVDNLRFDPLPGFHGYDEIAAQCRAAGRRVVVANVDTHHHNPMGFKSAESHQEWLRGDEAYRRKWGL